MLKGSERTAVAQQPLEQFFASTLGVELQSLEVRAADQFEGAFEAIARAQAGALIVAPSGFMGAHGRRIVDLVAKSRVPAIYPYHQFVDRGGLQRQGSL